MEISGSLGDLGTLLPMAMGMILVIGTTNAISMAGKYIPVVAYVDLSREYFQQGSVKVTCRSVCISMALANLAALLVGAMPLCHGAGGLAAHYRFGTRTAGSNLIIGTIFILSAALFGPHVLSILFLVPISVLGIGTAYALKSGSLKI